jgi:hypothetical protein
MCNNCYRKLTQKLHKTYSNQYQVTRKTSTYAYEILTGKFKFTISISLQISFTDIGTT